jgi:hypothetical protein
VESEPTAAAVDPTWAFADALLALDEFGHTDVSTRLIDRWPEVASQTLERAGLKTFRNDSRSQVVEGAYRSRTGGSVRNTPLDQAGRRDRNPEVVPTSRGAE